MTGPEPSPPRRGPRPLPLHLGLAAMRGWAAMAPLVLPSQTAQWLPDWLPAWPPWSGGWPRLRAGQAMNQGAGQAERSRILAALAAGGHPPEAFQAAVLRALARQDQRFLAGVTAYRRHPYRRQLPDPPAIWTEGASRLLDYHAAPARPRSAATVLFVPSLVNRANVLDLLPEASMLRFLAANGLRPVLLDWGSPAGAERGFGLTDIVAGRLERALAVVAADGPVVMAGYCMGGLLALAAALRRPDRVRGLALLATPWDFWTAEGEGPGEVPGARARALAGLLPGLEPLLEATGALPVDAIQALFAGLDPFAIAAKFRAFGRLDPQGPAARRFVALEDWLNDGVPLAAPVAREVLSGWYGANTPAKDEWRVAGQPVDPTALRLPALVVVPARDRIVPPASALALAGLIPGAAIHQAAAGHIGMVAGGGAEAALWRPLLRWVDGL